jgi:hypothetical protein
MTHPFLFKRVIKFKEKCSTIKDAFNVTKMDTSKRGMKEDA